MLRIGCDRYFLSDTKMVGQDPLLHPSPEAVKPTFQRRVNFTLLQEAGIPLKGVVSTIKQYLPFM